MKYFILFFCLLGANGLHAQQPKAYETIYYTASIKNLHFKLIYADGYLAATKIRLKKQVFLPISGAPKRNGDFVLQCKTSKIILMKILEEETAAPIISARYIVDGQGSALIFRQRPSR